MRDKRGVTRTFWQESGKGTETTALVGGERRLLAGNLRQGTKLKGTVREKQC